MSQKFKSSIDVDGTATATTFIGALTGNASTATTLQTARTINGTSFNGSADITTANWGTARTINGTSINGSTNYTTANWGTARTITIGSTGKSVNGSANVSWSLAEINALKVDESVVAIGTADLSSGTWTTATATDWGTPRIGTQAAIYNDAPGYRQYNIPAGMDTCFISQLTWSSGGYVDVHGVQADGGLVFLRRINTKQNVENTNEGNGIATGQHDGCAVVLAATGLSTFTAIRFTNILGRFHFTGMSFTSNRLLGSEGTGMVHPSQISHQGSGSGLIADKATTLETARTLTIGSTGKTFNGSGNVSWTLAEIGALGSTEKAADSNLLDGLDSTYFDHRRYTDSTNYLGGHYVSGGTEKPNNAVFGAGKFKVAMLSGGNLGFGGSWNDVMWISTYSGGDVKSSHALVFDKYSSNVWVSDQNFDSASWGTGYLFITSANIGSQSVSSAATLTTARTINGTSFNGSADITTANWGTARTLTIGNTGKSVNGSGNVSWSLAEIGALGATAKAADSELLDGLDSTQFSRVYRGTASFSNAAFVNVFNVSGDALASAVRFSVQGTTGSVVVNVLADLLVNHYQDILITTQSGFYTTLSIRVQSNQDEAFSVLMSTNSANVGTFNIEVFPLNNETITFGGTATTGVTLTHVAYYGNATSGSGGNLGDIRTAGSFIGSLSGNASTATSAATLTTARTFTIGSTGKSFNGSGDLSWTLAEIGVPSTTGFGASGTWGISVSGNAATATTLQTARTINGTSFNGSANITTANWGTARTINGVSINGSTNYTIEPYVERDDSTNALRYLTFVDDSNAEHKRLNMDNGLMYNPSTGTLISTLFSGTLSGAVNTIYGSQIVGSFTGAYTTDSSPQALLLSNTSASTSAQVLKIRTSSSTTMAAISFWNLTTLRGHISVTGSGTTYNSVSDYRLKENIVDLENASDRLMKLKPKRFSFINGDGQMVDGFLAHEAQEIVPEAVEGQKDAVDENGNPAYQGIDQSKLIPLLTAALQDALKRIDQLEKLIQTK